MNPVQHKVIVDSDQLNYTGVWNRLPPSPSGGVLTGVWVPSERGVTASLSFNGTSVTIFGFAYGEWSWRCVLDGVDLPSPSSTPLPTSTICQANNLSNSPHSLFIVVQDGQIELSYASYTSWTDYNNLLTDGAIIKVFNADLDIDYYGAWGVTNIGLRITSHSTSGLTFPFTGSQIGWYTEINATSYTSPFALNCTVDGEHPQSTTITTTPIRPGAILTTDPLPIGNHELECIYNTLGANAIPLTLDYLFVILDAVPTSSSSSTMPSTPTHPTSDSSSTASNTTQASLVRPLVGSIIGAAVFITAVFAFSCWRKKRTSRAAPFQRLPITKDRHTPSSTSRRPTTSGFSQFSRASHLPEPELVHHPPSTPSNFEQLELEHHPFSTPSAIELHHSLLPARQRRSRASSPSLDQHASSSTPTPSISSSAVYASTLPISQYSDPFADSASSRRSESVDDRSSRLSSSEATSLTKPSPLPEPPDGSQALRPGPHDQPPLYYSH